MIAAQTKPRAFVVWWKDLEKWDFLSAYIRRQFRSSHLLSPLKDLVSIRWTPATAEELSSGKVSMVDRVSFAGEIFAGEKRETKMEQFVAHPGDLVVSKIRARQGSIGLVDEKQGVVSVTIHYRAITPNTELLNPVYAWLALRSQFCRAQFLAATGGAMKGEISEESLLKIQIPLPPLAEQKAIVARWREAQSQIAAARERVEKKKREMDARFFADLGLKAPAQTSLPKCFAVWWKDFLRWDVSFFRNATFNPRSNKFPNVCLKDVMEITTTRITPCNFAEQTFNYLGMENVESTSGEIVSFSPRKGHTIKSSCVRFDKNKILYGKLRPYLRKVVDCSELPFEDGIASSEFLSIRPKENVLQNWLAIFLRSTAIAEQAKIAIGARMPRISSDAFLNFIIPLPPLPMQREIIARVASGRAEIARERERAARLAAEIETEIESRILGANS